MLNRSSQQGDAVAVMIKDCPYFTGQLLQRERFLEEVVFDIDHIVVQHRLPGIAGDE
jgi:hypothetical protein